MLFIPRSRNERHTPRHPHPTRTPAPTAEPTITVVVTRRGHTARVCLSGDIDMAAEPQLTATIEQLERLAPRAVTIDLEQVSFAGATFASFLIQIHRLLPDPAELTLCRPTTMIRVLVQILDLETITTICQDDPSHDGPVPHLLTQLRHPWRNRLARVRARTLNPQHNTPATRIAEPAQDDVQAIK